MLCSFLLCSGSLVWKHAFFTEHPKGWHHFALLKEQSKGEGSAMREGSYSQSDTEEPAEVTPRRKDRFFIPISASYIASKGSGTITGKGKDGKGKDVHGFDCECEKCFFESLSRSFWRIRKPQTAMGSPFPGGWGDDSDIDYQSMEEAFFTMDCKASSTIPSI